MGEEKEKIKKIYKLADVYHSENIGKVYQRLIIMIDDNKESYIRNLNDVLSSWIIEKIDNYNSSLYYENPDYIYECYKEGKII